MTNEEIQQLFEEKFETTHHHFHKWVYYGICTKEQFVFFVKWLNQLNEKELCKLLVSQFTILKFIENQTESLCKMAIRSNCDCLQFIKDQTKELCELAIRTDQYSIEYIRDQTVDLCILSLEEDFAFKISYKCVRIVPNPDYETTLKNLKEKKAILEALK